MSNNTTPTRRELMEAQARLDTVNGLSDSARDPKTRLPLRSLFAGLIAESIMKKPNNLSPAEKDLIHVIDLRVSESTFAKRAASTALRLYGHMRSLGKHIRSLGSELDDVESSLSGRLAGLDTEKADAGVVAETMNQTAGFIARVLRAFRKVDSRQNSLALENAVLSARCDNLQRELAEFRMHMEARANFDIALPFVVETFGVHPLDPAYTDKLEALVSNHTTLFGNTARLTRDVNTVLAPESADRLYDYIARTFGPDCLTEAAMEYSKVPKNENGTEVVSQAGLVQIMISFLAAHTMGVAMDLADQYNFQLNPTIRLQRRLAVDVVFEDDESAREANFALLKTEFGAEAVNANMAFLLSPTGSLMRLAPFQQNCRDALYHPTYENPAANPVFDLNVAELDKVLVSLKRYDDLFGESGL